MIICYLSVRGQASPLSIGESTNALAVHYCTQQIRYADLLSPVRHVGSIQHISRYELDSTGVSQLAVTLKMALGSDLGCLGKSIEAAGSNGKTFCLASQAKNWRTS
jgi:hypothetical protein